MRSVNKQIIDEWIANHGPNGLFRLAEVSGVSAWTIAKARGGSVPRKSITRKLIADALGVDAEVLFPTKESISA
jgi:lambda repressor-like predicted transcriptional regulator